MNRIKSIDITFENCESFTIPSSCIEFMNVEGFKTRYFINNANGNYSKINRAYYVYLKIKDSNEIKKDYNFSEEFFIRVKKYNDITSIQYNYDNGKRFKFYVPWNYKDKQYNSWQKVKEVKDGIIHIEIKRRKEDR